MVERRTEETRIHIIFGVLSPDSPPRRGGLNLKRPEIGSQPMLVVVLLRVLFSPLFFSGLLFCSGDDTTVHVSVTTAVLLKRTDWQLGLGSTSLHAGSHPFLTPLAPGLGDASCCLAYVAVLDLLPYSSYRSPASSLSGDSLTI